MSSQGVSHEVKQIREFAEGVEDPEKWTIVVPTSLFDDVVSQLDTTHPLGTKFKGISLCYAAYDETETYVKYRSELSDHE